MQLDLNGINKRIFERGCGKVNLEDLYVSVSDAVLRSVITFVEFIPSFIGGLIILFIGLVVAGISHRLILGSLKVIKLEQFLAKYGITKLEGKDIEWSEILAQIARWTIIVIFLVPALEAWRLSAVNAVLNRVILYIPNVIVAVVLAMIGLVFARIGYKVAYNAAKALGKQLANTVALVAQWSITIFTGFLVLHQLGVAQELLRILFAGLVAMIAIAGGLAFGLGGQHTAKQILEEVWNKFHK
ncbi:hypothetical protein A2982_02295 [candidate division WWE3 bacterium RIFCSPLOWO2_01_FULL_39_13]|uniref:Uncharacterized protein n=1 Tax=candidate division WWE3 bacterium RIFCSPLOWO2_01_FULL_39_13 TaxID=1802624 RepID=A0A1F4V377_UNCKA|nr:MAG: hypothetical protein A2982_02295 [candidate division WWE3 bacterium RIFCSPLOWO2_01_FULL_39_13]